MVRLVTSEDVRERMALDPALVGANPTIESALTAAHLRLETEYDSKLSRGVSDETFYLDPVIHNGVRPGGMYRLQLNHAFVRTAPMPVDAPIAVTAGWSVANESVTEGLTRLDAVKGILYVPESFGGQYVRVVYEYGFVDGEEDFAPDWLKEAILAYVPVVLNFSNPNADPKKERMNRQSGDHAMAIVAPYRRNVGFCLRPVF